MRVFHSSLMSGRQQHSEGQALALRGKGDRFSPKKPSRYRSAGACPPRAFGRPEPGEGQALALRWEEGVLGDVARGPVPRERSVDRSLARETRSPARVASEGPRPTGRGGVFSTVARGPVTAALNDLGNTLMLMTKEETHGNQHSLY